MNDRPLVSAIIIFLNTERYIEEAIESVFAQTYENWELLLVDDGSTDGSTEIARGYAERHPQKVRYLEHPGRENRGMSASRNLGVRQAGGEYVAFLDADDAWLERKLEEQVRILDSRPETAMVYGNTLYWHSWTGKAEDLERDHVPDLGVPTETLFEPPKLFTLFYPLGKNSAPSTSNMLLRRASVERVGGFEEGFKGMYEEHPFVVKMYLKERVFVSGECWDKYRQHPDSCSATERRNGRTPPKWLYYLNWLAGYLYEQGMEDPEIWKLLRKHRSFVRVRVHVQEREWNQAARGVLLLLRRYPLEFFRRLFGASRRAIRFRSPEGGT
jgi:glycosyltransferase involved in cell wall biosynthesis